VIKYFEQWLVLCLVASLLLIHWLVEYKVAFLSFYYLPVILAGFFVGKRTAVWSAVLVVALVLFFQVVRGLEGADGLYPEILFTLIPWGGFLILTGYVVGSLAEQRLERLNDLRDAYLTMLELLAFQLEASEKEGVRGHSHRVSALAGRLAQELGLDELEIANLRVAALLHEIGPENPRLLRLLARFPGSVRQLPIAGSLRGATRILGEYARYYELVGEEWLIDRLALSQGTKILAVADAYETLQLPSSQRPALSPWKALAEIEEGAGRIFASEAVKALKRVVRILASGERGAILIPTNRSLRL
jgi:hypothetical protein